ncbi:unnamed protein product [Amoebophrya sp. A120]|nr:unnamed protein product [Amoebophrya sp. A120]|eukprot:GSA120T00003883001.1
MPEKVAPLPRRVSGSDVFFEQHEDDHTSGQGAASKAKSKSSVAAGGKRAKGDGGAGALAFGVLQKEDTKELAMDAKKPRQQGGHSISKPLLVKDEISKSSRDKQMERQEEKMTKRGSKGAENSFKSAGATTTASRGGGAASKKTTQLPASLPRDPSQYNGSVTKGKAIIGVDEAGRGPLAGPVVCACVAVKDGELPPESILGVTDSKKLNEPQRREVFAQLQKHAKTMVTKTIGLTGKESNIYGEEQWCISDTTSSMNTTSSRTGPEIMKKSGGKNGITNAEEEITAASSSSLHKNLHIRCTIVPASRIDEINILEATFEGMVTSVNNLVPESLPELQKIGKVLVDGPHVPSAWTDKRKKMMNMKVMAKKALKGGNKGKKEKLEDMVVVATLNNKFDGRTEIDEAAVAAAVPAWKKGNEDQSEKEKVEGDKVDCLEASLVNKLPSPAKKRRESDVEVAAEQAAVVAAEEKRNGRSAAVDSANLAAIAFSSTNKFASAAGQGCLSSNGRGAGESIVEQEASAPAADQAQPKVARRPAAGAAREEDGKQEKSDEAPVFVPPPFEVVPVIKGDGKEWLIAAASIVAKVIRDEILENLLEKQYPQYGFARHKGYGTAFHMEALKKFGPCREHRMSYEPVRLAVEGLGAAGKKKEAGVAKAAAMKKLVANKPAGLEQSKGNVKIPARLPKKGTSEQAEEQKGGAQMSSSKTRNKCGKAMKALAGDKNSRAAVPSSSKAKKPASAAPHVSKDNNVSSAAEEEGYLADADFGTSKGMKKPASSTNKSGGNGGGAGEGEGGGNEKKSTMKRTRSKRGSLADDEAGESSATGQKNIDLKSMKMTKKKKM